MASSRVMEWKSQETNVERMQKKKVAKRLSGFSQRKFQPPTLHLKISPRPPLSTSLTRVTNLRVRSLQPQTPFCRSIS